VTITVDPDDDDPITADIDDTSGSSEE